MNAKKILVIAAVLVVLGAGYAVARPQGGFWNGMMGSYGQGNGMMGNAGYCNVGESYGTNTAPISIEEAKEAVEQYLIAPGNSDLRITEIMEFENNFYAAVKEQSTGIHAFELLVNKYTGDVRPEMGPNMMWNTRYGHMGWNAPGQNTVTEKQALDIAQDYLDKALPGIKAGDVDEFYGYYTIEVMKDGKIYGMLSVNSNTGAVWYHSWHGAFVKILEVL